MGAWIEIKYADYKGTFWIGRTPRWVRGLKLFVVHVVVLLSWVAPHDGCVDWNYGYLWVGRVYSRRTPRWVRGLKFSYCLWVVHFILVAPHDGCVDWNFEIYTKSQDEIMSHPTMGAWIEIFNTAWPFAPSIGRTPRWVRGLKLYLMVIGLNYPLSHPTMGAWIEMSSLVNLFKGIGVAPHDGCVDWNLF